VSCAEFVVRVRRGRTRVLCDRPGPQLPCWAEAKRRMASSEDARLFRVDRRRSHVRSSWIGWVQPRLTP
jgi:hypothetical protein